MKAYDFFAGCGGASLGLAAAGVEVVLAFERDRDACASHRSSQYRMVGNACPPPLIAAVVRAILEADREG